MDHVHSIAGTDLSISTHTSFAMQSVPVSALTRITAVHHPQCVLHIVLDISKTSPPVDYTAGDVVHILPHNSPSDVMVAMAWLGCTGSEVLIPETESSGHASGYTVHELVTSHLDLTVSWVYF